MGSNVFKTETNSSSAFAESVLSLSNGTISSSFSIFSVMYVDKYYGDHPLACLGSLFPGKVRTTLISGIISSYLSKAEGRLLELFPVFF